MGRDRRWNLRDIRRHTRNGGQSDRVHGPAGLSWMELEIEDGHTHRLYPGLPRATGQLHRDFAVSTQYGGGPRSDDSSGRRIAADMAFWANGSRGLRSWRILRTSGI